MVIAMVMVLGLTSMAWAAPTNVNLTLPNNTGHTYSIFQIFKGDLADNKLSNVTWGKNGSGTEDALVADDVLEALGAIDSNTSSADQSTIDSILSALSITKASLTDASAFKTNVAAGAVESVPTGYYIVKDVDNSRAGQTDAETLLLISVVGPTTLTAKTSTTTVEKKVKDKNDSATAAANDAEDWKDSADYDIGDDVPFKLTATLAQNKSIFFSTILFF